MQSVISDQHFHDEAEAYKWVEARVWPNGPVCPHCGGVDRISPMKGKSTRIGTYKCYQCRKPFTVKVGTVFEASHIPMRHWLQAMHLMMSSKKGISSNQLHRILGCTLKTAWFMSHRLREAMRQGGLKPLGGAGKVVEVDEAYFGDIPEANRPKFTKSGRPVSANPGGPKNKRAVVSLVERGGRVRSFHPAVADVETVGRIVRGNIDRETRLHTDESKLYHRVGKEFAAHETVAHSRGEYARGDVTTNTIEGYFSVFKRGMRGTYQHCAEKHLQRYLCEFDFRHNNRIALGVNDEARTERAIKGIVGKRLTYRLAHQRT